MFRLLIDPPLEGATNMARDEALLVLRARGKIPPTLRLYQWSPACLSLGRFQRAGEVDREQCQAEGVHVVRRPSGGRALLHDAELTYALVASEDSFFGGSITASYHAISVGLLAGLQRLGVDAELTTDDRRPTTEKARRHHQSDGQQTTDKLQRTKTAACYDSPSAYELVVAGRKLIGSAQRRHNGALLQHGAIPFAPHAKRLCSLLRQPPADLAERMITLHEVLSRGVQFEEVAEALIEGCAEAWGVHFERGAWTENELAVAEELHAKYVDNQWTWGR